jgi:hypothetical protein
LQLHRFATVVLDEAAASWLNRRNDYRFAESAMPDPDELP